MTTNSTQSTDLLDRTPLLTTLTKASMGIVAAGLLAFIFVSEDILVSLAFHVPAFVGLGVVLVLLRFKFTELASAVFISLFWGIFLAACWTFDGVRSASMGGFLLVVIASGLLMSSRAAFGVAFASAAAGLLMVVADARGVLPDPIMNLTNSFKLVSWAMYFGMAAVLLHVTVSRLREAVATAAKNETAYLKAAEELRRTSVSKEYVEQIIRSMADAVLVLDAEGRIESVNTAARDMLGFSDDELIGIKHDSLLVGASSMLRKESSVRRLEATYAGADERRVRVTLSMAMIRDADGKAEGLVCIAHDISAREQVRRALEDARADAEAASLAKGDLLANMHQLLSAPLNEIIAATGVVLEESDPGTVRKELERIREKSQGLLEAVGDIKDEGDRIGTPLGAPKRVGPQ